MGCRVAQTPGGTVIMCGRGQKDTPACIECVRDGKRIDSVVLCDFRLPPYGGKKSKTCDRPLCRKHSTSGGPGIDYCPAHAPKVKTKPEPPASGELF